MKARAPQVNVAIRGFIGYGCTRMMAGSLRELVPDDHVPARWSGC